jgi:hypothetical protein
MGIVSMENDMLTHQSEKLYGNDIRIGKKTPNISKYMALGIVQRIGW